MSSILFRVGRFSFRHKWWVITAWLAALVAIVAAVGALQPKFSQDFELPGTDGGTAMTQMADYFPAVNEAQSESNTLVFVAADDGLANHRAEVDSLVADLSKLPEVVNSPEAPLANPLTIAEKMPAAASQVIGDDGRVGRISVHQAINVQDLTAEDKTNLKDILERHRVDGLKVEAQGGAMNAQEAGGTAEVASLGLAFVIMIVAFGVLVAAFIPLITAIVGVGITFMLVTLAAEVISINVSATGIIMMLGIAVSIDYALFIVSRYRSEVSRGGDRADAAGRAVGTAGSAVVFAGLTVMIAVAALAVIGLPFITQMGLGAALAVFVAVFAALTFIPALLGAFGRFAFAGRIPWIKNAEENEESNPLGVRFGRTIVKRPLPFIIVGLAVLILAAIPIKGLQLGLSMDSDDQVAAHELATQGFGAGVGGELYVVVHTDKGTVDTAVTTAVGEIQKLPNVVLPEQISWMGNGSDPKNPNANANTALVVVTPDSSPSSTETHDLVEKIRDLSPTIEAKGAEIHVGGQTAIMSDLSAKLDKAFIPYLLVVVGLAFLIMIGVFRSIWVPLIGTLGFVFSVLATFGITSWIFTDGAFNLIAHPKPLLSFLPIFLVGVVFGLAMDYQVFLVTRMREEFMHGMSAKDAIIAGYRHGARVVTTAAVIMICVFASFMLGPDTTTKMMGFALAIAVFFDAFIIRMTVVPAVIAMLGDRAWGLPKWLDKAVVDFDIEGSKVRDRGVETTVDAESPAEVK